METRRAVLYLRVVLVSLTVTCTDPTPWHEVGPVQAQCKRLAGGAGREPSQSHPGRHDPDNRVCQVITRVPAYRAGTSGVSVTRNHT